ncbi:head GIN domain-containing protein [Aquimarina brevivitae]|uniref:Putative autotransporter adhesin-like protein n=1 Tax=Aquimarina brevivitae TaxID=323412 RepID=A0A4Q7PGV8_9FLAO|nr:head GIN domain-containing protein [Aquimarina brevivitae]RZS99771.1 putative autotransporter adhesin-like protein [Aquimarina brevivitae]
MKVIGPIIIAVLILISCGSENSWDCLQTTGEIITEEVEVVNFNAISVLQRSQLIISQGTQRVRVETGENLINDVEVYVDNGTLIIDNKNSCNLVRDYGVTKVYVTIPDITEIRNASGLPVIGEGVLSVTELTLTSDDLEEEDLYRKVGDFRLNLDVDQLTIITNGKSNFFLDGRATAVDINFLDGDNRCECTALDVNTLSVFHRGTNDIIIAPQTSVTGELRSTGNLILRSRPAVVDLQELYTGRLIYQD